MKESKKKSIALIYEGVKAEKELFENMQQIYLSEFYDVNLFALPADGNIYMLWKQLVDDEFETDVIAVLKEMSSEARQQIDDHNLKVSDFSEIYLFFDYDGHACSFSEETVHEANELCKRLGMTEIKNKWDLLERMLDIFDNETGEGKLYVSYPMVESVKEIDYEQMEYQRLYISLDEISNYKHSFERRTDYGNYTVLTKDMWNSACLASVKQANLIVFRKSSCSYDEFIDCLTQQDIYHAQKAMYINSTSGKVLAVLNSLPLFLLEYFDEGFWNRVITSGVGVAQ